MDQLLKIDPTRLNFGPPAAEREKNLAQYFFESKSFQRLKSGKKIVALGNRGAGKTALFKTIAEQARQQNKVVIELTPNDYSYEMLKASLLEEGDGFWAKQGAYTAAWKYVLYIHIMKSVTEAGPLIKRGPSKKIYEFLRDKHANISKNPIGTLISYLKRMESVKVMKYSAGIKAHELEKLYKLEDIIFLMPYLEKIVAKLPVVILVDELDRGWDDSEDARTFVAGLFNAAMSVNQQFAHSSNGVKVMLSLRLEIYRSIPNLFEDAQKYRDLIEIIEWDEDSLLELICKRIKVSLPELSFLRAEHLWPRIFNAKMKARNNRTFDYIIDRTMLRPRELIQFCETIKENAINKELTMPFGDIPIKESELLHSETRLKDVAAEYRFEFPGLEQIFETFRGVKYNLKRDDLEYHCLRIIEGDFATGPACSWCSGLSIESMIRKLWIVGFIKAKAPGSSRRSARSAYVASYQTGNLNLENIKHFQVHPMFRKYLGMKPG